MPLYIPRVPAELVEPVRELVTVAAFFRDLLAQAAGREPPVLWLLAEREGDLNEARRVLRHWADHVGLGERAAVRADAAGPHRRPPLARPRPPRRGRGRR